MQLKNEFKVVPLTTETWNDFVQLFGEKGACGGCWCMSWRLLKADFDKGKGEENKNAIHQLVKKQKPVGYLGYINDEAVAWCAVAPREVYLRLEKSRVLKRPDDEQVWSITCFFIAKEWRNKGISVTMIKEVVQQLKKENVKLIEAYPQEPKGILPAPFVWTGLTSAFVKAGFKEVIRYSKVRPIMRYEIK